MKHLALLSSAVMLTAISAYGCSESPVTPVEITQQTSVRPSATPLITVDPYFSIWSSTDNINESATVHWTGIESPLLALVRIDGETYRVLGKEKSQWNILVNTIQEGDWEAKYHIGSMPAKGWTDDNFDDSSWPAGPGAIGSEEREYAKTRWEGNNSDVWVRRTFTLDEVPESLEDIFINYTHDENFELYLNGVEIVNTGNCYRDDVMEALSPAGASALRKGTNILAAHCHNSRGDCFVDFGLKQKVKAEDITLTAKQTSLSILPTRTIAGFACGPVHIDLIFTAPLFLGDLDLVSRPVNYVTYQATSLDGAKHDVQIYFAASPEQAVNTPGQSITARSGQQDGMAYAMAGTVEQPILRRKGDNVRIDWGYVYLSSGADKGDVAVTPYFESIRTFAGSGCQTEGLNECTRKTAVENPVSLSYVNNLGKVGEKTVADFIMLAYDDIFSVQFFEENLRPYWNRSGDKTITGQLALASEQYDDLMARCIGFDKKLMDDACASGGKEYSELCALAYRQSIAAHKLVESPDAGLLFLSKENFSNGSIGTVDVTYPSAPLFLYYNTELAKGLMNHIFYYSESGKWTKPFAAHDVGTYPHANGQTYGGDMPVEECGNMLILTGAVAKIDGNADYALKHWDALTTWVEYLEKYGLDPDNQLCTDDFAGHFAHNTNLSIKAVMGIESYGMLADMLGKKDEAQRYHAMAKDMAAKWKEKAADGDHYRLTFDKAGTWSQKYNLVWDKILGSNVFDPEIAATEIAYYRGKQNRYGLPLDNRKTYTKTDWIIWTATMAASNEDFETFIKPIYLFQNETTDRIPMSDWIYTDSTTHVGFQARSVVGGYFIKLLSDKLE